MKMKKILIANRGEIAVRIIKTARKLGIKTVAIYSEADVNSMAVQMADEAFYIGPSPSNLSYLNVAKILEVVQESGSDAVHPGYGFLSENANFANELEKIGVNFIGPAVAAVQSMGDKIISKLSESQLSEFNYKHPLGFGEVNDITELILFLLSDKSKWITGQNIKIDGGYSSI